MGKPMQIHRFVVPVLLGTLAGGVLARAPGPVGGVEPLALVAVPVALDPADPARRDVGRLRYLGGLVLTSPNAAFGGVSALRARDDGRFLGITDTGNWVTFDVVEAGDRLTGVRGGVIAPLLAADGQPARAKADADAEGLEWAADGTATVSFEQDHRLQVYAGIDPRLPATLARAPVAVRRSPLTGRWPINGGGEAYAATGPGASAWFAEEGRSDDGDRDVLLSDGGVTTRRGYRSPGDLSPTDAILLSPGHLLVLARHYSPAGGVVVGLSEVALTPGDGPLEGREIARLAPPLTVDNLEGLALRRTAGRTFVYLVSDDNFNGLQRTLLLKFELVGR